MNSLIDTERPWPGLLPFTEEARSFFHGRELETDALVRLIEREPLAVLFGQSGLGKSSLLSAGVFPLLRRAGYLPVYLRLNLDVGSPALMEQVWQTLKDECLNHDVSATAPHSGDSLWKYLHRPGTGLLNPHGRPVTPVLAFDQFEELFTIGRQSPDQNARCQTLLKELGELIENRLPPDLEAELTEQPETLDDFDLLRQNIKIVFSFREDYLAEFEGLKALIRPIMQNRMRLTPMAGDRAAQAIQLAGEGRVSEAVADRIVRFVGGVGRDETWALESVLVEPALLSLVCRELNEQRIQRQEAEIGPDLIQGDNAKHIIEHFYQQCFAGLDKEVQHFVEDRLLTTAGYRDSCALDNAQSEPGITAAVLETLVERRLLRREERGGIVRLELIHDVLTKTATASRDARREAEAQATLAKMLARQQRQNRWLVSGGVLLVIIQCVAIWLVWDIFQLKAEARHTLGLWLSVQADGAFAEKRTNEAKIYAAHALARLDKERSGGLRAALRGQRLTTVVAMADAQAGVVHSVAFSPDGLSLATARGKRVRFWDAVRFKPLSELMQGHDGEVYSVAFSPDSKTVASGSADTTVRLWDTASRMPLGEPLRGHENGVSSVAFSPDGKTLASAGYDNTVRLWDVASRKPLGEALHGHQSAVYSVAFSLDGQTLASGSYDKTVQLWDVASRKPIGEPLRGHDSVVYSVAFSPDGKTLASGGWDQTVRLWDIASRKPVGEPLHQQAKLFGSEVFSPVSSLAFSHDGKTLAAGSGNKTVVLWDMASRPPSGTPLGGHAGGVTAVAFSPDGQSLATGSQDKSLRLLSINHGELAITDWASQASQEEALYGLTLKEASLVPEPPNAAKTSINAIFETVRDVFVTGSVLISLHLFVGIFVASGLLYLRLGGAAAWLYFRRCFLSALPMLLGVSFAIAPKYLGLNIDPYSSFLLTVLIGSGLAWFIWRAFTLFPELRLVFPTATSS